MPAVTEVKPWRLFLGLWPTADVRDALQRHAAAWHWPPAARRTAPERLHITLHFLGDVEAARLPALERQLATVAWHGCRLELEHAAVWPGGIAVLEALQVPPPLAALHADLGEVLRGLGFALETRPYRPHVTLARKGQGARPPTFAPLAWELAPQFVLVRSLPGGRGYEPVQVLG